MRTVFAMNQLQEKKTIIYNPLTEKTTYFII